ncbi:MAG TPA: SIS domain-containing protein [Firmicutes bacterium]|nr:SIS domain-containing protein [Bacillota bacterium]
MPNALDNLINLGESEKERLGAIHTPSEIRRQPCLWADTAERMRERLPEIKDSMVSADRTAGGSAARSIVLSGAGSSDYVGRSVEQLLRRRLGVNVDSRPTTDVLVNPLGILIPAIPYLVVLFSRSGGSPESMGTFEVVRKVCHDARFLVITCNPEGDLARLSDRHPGEVIKVVLDPRTNDKGLAMTSSFTNMTVAGQALGFIDEPDQFKATVERMAEAGERILSDYSDVIHDLAGEPFERAVFLGSGALTGVAHEAALKLQELTDGRVITKSESFLGLRHGPEAVVDERTLVVYFVSQDSYRFKYEMDLMQELRDKSIGLRKLAVAARASSEFAGLVDECIEFDPHGRLAIPDDLRPPVDVIVGQLLGLFKSLELGLSPDNPSARGVINRVVQGVRLYSLD